MESFAEQMRGLPRDDLWTTFGETVRYYSLAATKTIVITAVRESKVTALSNQGAFYVARENETFKVKSSDLNFGSGVVAPARGDTITDSDARQYEYSGDGELLPNLDAWRLPVGQVA